MKTLAIFLLGIASLFAQSPAPNTLGVFAGTGDKTFCVATKGSGLTPSISVTCRRAGITKCNGNTIDTSVFSCGDVLWIFNTQANIINYQAAVNDRDATGNIIGNHIASQGFWQFTNPIAQK